MVARKTVLSSSTVPAFTFPCLREYLDFTEVRSAPGGTRNPKAIITSPENAFPCWSFVRCLHFSIGRIRIVVNSRIPKGHWIYSDDCPPVCGVRPHSRSYALRAFFPTSVWKLHNLKKRRDQKPKLRVARVQPPARGTERRPSRGSLVSEPRLLPSDTQVLPCSSKDMFLKPKLLVFF